MSIRVMSASVLVVAGAAGAQTTVDYNTSGWKDFGNGSVSGLVGNFQPGWTSVQATPDYGTDNLFGIPVQTLSGAADDAAVWLNQFDSSNPNNEIVSLSLSGFTIGNQYELTFFATIVHAPSGGGWIGNEDRIEIALAGADMPSTTTSLLVDDAPDDAMNEWVAQSITFVARADVVSFAFGADAVVDDPDASISRLGIDGFDLVPAPGASVVGAGLVLLAGRRRR